MTSFPRSVLVSSVVYALSLLHSQLAVAQEAEAAEAPKVPALPTELPGQTKTELQDQTATEASATQPSTTFVSDGQAMTIESLGVKITPPKGWEVTTNTGSLSVVMREPKVEAPDYEKPKYQRNITLATRHQASPIDEKRAQELKEEMTKTFSQDGMVSNFQIIEHKFFNYRGQNDGLLVYSSLSIGEYPMMQMHVLVSGGEKQFLMTYTDLAERFSDSKDGAFEAAWSSIVSIEVSGETPNRENEYLRYGIAAGGFLLLGMTLFLVRRKARKVDYNGEADAMIESDGDSYTGGSIFATLAQGWKLDGKDDGVSGLEFVSQAASPRTRQTEYVSNY